MDQKETPGQAERWWGRGRQACNPAAVCFACLVFGVVSACFNVLITSLSVYVKFWPRSYRGDFSKTPKGAFGLEMVLPLSINAVLHNHHLLLNGSLVNSLCQALSRKQCPGEGVDTEPLRRSDSREGAVPPV